MMIPRAYLRVPMGLVMRLTGVKEAVRIVDASPNGFQIQTRAALKKGGIFPFAIQLPEDQEIRGRLMIRWARPQGEKRDCVYGAKVVFSRPPSQMERPMSSSQR